VCAGADQHIKEAATITNKHPMDCRLSWLENANSRPRFLRAIFTSIVDQTDLVFGA